MLIKYSGINFWLKAAEGASLPDVLSIKFLVLAVK